MSVVTSRTARRSRHSGRRWPGTEMVSPWAVSVQVSVRSPKSAGTVTVNTPVWRRGRKCVGWPWSCGPGLDPVGGADRDVEPLLVVAVHVTPRQVERAVGVRRTTPRTPASRSGRRGAATGTSRNGWVCICVCEYAPGGRGPASTGATRADDDQPARTKTSRPSPRDGLVERLHVFRAESARNVAPLYEAQKDQIVPAGRPSTARRLRRATRTSRPRVRRRVAPWRSAGRARSRRRARSPRRGRSASPAPSGNWSVSIASTEAATTGCGRRPVRPCQAACARTAGSRPPSRPGRPRPRGTSAARRSACCCPRRAPACQAGRRHGSRTPGGARLAAGTQKPVSGMPSGSKMRVRMNSPSPMPGSALDQHARDHRRRVVHPALARCKGQRQRTQPLHVLVGRGVAAAHGRELLRERRLGRDARPLRDAEAHRVAQQVARGDGARCVVHLVERAARVAQHLGVRELG